MSSEPSGLPDGWKLVKLAELCLPVGHVNPRRTPGSVFKYVDISSIDSRRNEIANPKTITSENAPTRARKPVRASDVLFATVRPYLKNVALVPQLLDGQIASTGFAVLRSNGQVDPRYLFRAVLADDFVNRVTSLQRGISYPAVTEKVILDQEIPVPPLHEQHRLVEKLESLLSQSRTAREALDRIPPLMKAFRQSVLAKAFRGELAERDPNDEPASVLLDRIRAERRRKWEEGLRARGKAPRRHKYVEPEPPDPNGLPELPEGWLWVHLGLISEVRSGVTKGRRLPTHGVMTVPYLRVANVQRGYLDLREVKTIEIREGELQRYLLEPGDILFTEGGDRDKLGRGTVWQGEISPCIHQNHIHCARPVLNLVSPEFVSFASQLPYARDYFWDVASQTVNLASVNSTNLRAFPVPLAPLAAQRRIAARIQVLLSWADAIEQAAGKGRQKAEGLDQAVLARAFAGGL